MKKDKPPVDGVEEALPYSGDGDKVKAELESALSKADDYKNLLQRLQADFENHMKRSDTERKDLIRFASKDIIMRLLSVLDSMELALKVKPKSEGETKMLDGFRKVSQQLNSVLSVEGLSEIKSDGIFDHDFHEAVETVEDSSKPEGAIVDIIQKGYMLNGKVIRTSKVTVVKNKKGDVNG